jgi:23S rRNA (guanosine2251-2'-O)-methyltransferase
MHKRHKHDFYKKSNAQTTPQIMGKNCLWEVLQLKPKRIKTILTSKTRDQTSEDPLLKEAIQENIPIRYVSKDELSNLLQSESHQGYAAYISRDNFLDVNTFFENLSSEEEHVVIALDSINDPQNFGSILRAAECFGASAVLWSKNRGVDLTPTVAKTSVGASEILPLIQVNNLVETVKSFKQEGFKIIASELSQDAASLYELRFQGNILFILGSEGEGIRPLLSRQADEKVYIPMRGRIDSLNVSQATSVLLSHYRQCCPK